MTDPRCGSLDQTTALKVTQCTCTNEKQGTTDRLRPLALFLLMCTLCWGLIIGIVPATAELGSNSSRDDDEKAVAALDTQYQAAVKTNDVSTMNRILADDFILVTGSGKTYTKSGHAEQCKKRGHELRT